MKLQYLALGALMAAGVAQAEVTFTPSATYTAPDSRKNYDNAFGYSLSLGYRFIPAFGVELNYARTESELHGSPKHLPIYNGTDTKDSRLGLDAYYAFNADGAFSPYLLLGGGQNHYETKAPHLKPSGQANSTENFRDAYINAGVGAFYRLTENVALRAEYRNVYNPDETLFDNVGLLGIELSTGKAVAPVVAATPEPQPQPEPVEKIAAAPVDSDGDNVPDDRDNCANTPAGVQVDSNGCPLDGDKDNVPDYLDKCPNTSEGVIVDEKGCDKILTEAIKRELNISFDSAKAVVKDEYKADIADLAKLLKQYPATFVEIQGHTDSSGKKAKNQKLSQERADAVKAVLVNEFGVGSSRVTAVGYGSSQPAADNKTAEGRAKNRRVLAIVSGEARKVQYKKK